MITKAILEKPKIYTINEYLDLEINSNERHEYIKGEIIKMTGGTPNHNKIAGNLYAALNFALKKQPFQVFFADQRVWIPKYNIYTYPDIMIIKDDLQFQEGRKDTLINPYIIIEVLSKSTRSYDKDDKFTAYRSIETFCEYLLIDQYKLQIDHYSKTDKNQWLFREYKTEKDVINFDKIDFEISLIDIYDKVDFYNE
jgi:Uma2 family endonuclease